MNKHTKEIRMLALFVDGFKLNRIEAIPHGDTCLNSTVSKLESKHQLHFSRRNEKRRNAHGMDSTFTRYWLEGENLELARCIVQRARLPQPGLI